MEHGVNDELASRWARLAATLVDFATFAAILGFIAAPFLVQYSTSHESLVVMCIIAIITILVLQLKQVYQTGQTIGKKMMDVSIVDLEGRQATFRTIFFFRMIPITILMSIPVIGALIAIINMVLIFSDDKRCLHDHIAKTQVIRTTATSRIEA